MAERVEENKGQYLTWKRVYIYIRWKEGNKSSINRDYNSRVFRKKC